MERADGAGGGSQTTKREILLAASDSNTFARNLKLQMPRCRLLTPRDMEKFLKEWRIRVCQSTRSKELNLPTINPYTDLVFVFDDQLSSKCKESDIKEFRLQTVREAQKLKDPNSHVVVVLDGKSPYDLVQFDSVLSRFTNVISSEQGVVQVATYVKDRINNVTEV